MNIKNKSGIALLVTLFVVLVLSILLSAVFLRTDAQLAETGLMRSVQESFYAAEAGIERAVFELRRDPDFLLNDTLADVPVKVSEEEEARTVGFFTLRVIDGGLFNNLGETRWVQSIGRDPSNQKPRIINARVLIDDPSRFLVSTPGTLEVKSGAQINADLLASDLEFAVNETLEDEERAITVNGDVFYINSLFPDDPDAHPDIEINGDVTQYPAVTFPGVDVDLYADIAQNSGLAGFYYDGDLDVDLDHLDDLNPEEGFHPQIIFATGSIDIKGNIPHSMLVVSGGNINITGDIKYEGAELPEGEVGPQIGLFAKSDMLIPDGVVSTGEDMTIEAFVVADGGGDSNGIFAARSSTVLGQLNFKGAMSVRGEGTDSSIDLNIFAERNYQHSPNKNIPFTPLIANIIQWQEADSAEPFPPVSSGS